MRLAVVWRAFQTNGSATNSKGIERRRAPKGRIWIPPPSWKPPTHSPCEARAGRGLGRGAPSIELARLIGIPSPLPSPHSSVVGRGNRPAAWWWCQDTPQALLGPTWRLHSARERFILIVHFVRGARSRVNDAVVAHERFA